MPTPKQRVEAAERRLFARYDLDVDSHYVQLDSPRIRIRVLEAGNGPPLLLLHGAGEISSQWAPMLTHLVDQRHVIAVDLPGFGLSQEVDYDVVNPRTYGVEVIRGVFDSFELASVPVVANSLGGAWGLWLALDASQRLSALALLGCPVFALRGARLNAAMATMSVPGVNRFVLNLPVPPLRVNRAMYKYILGSDAIETSPPEIVEVAHHAMDRPTFATSLTSLLEQTVGLSRPRKTVALTDEELGRVEHPVLFVWGDNDSFGGIKLAERTVAKMPDARLRTVHGGHNPWLNEPERCAQLVLEFFTQHDT